jgi:hypothetical protein
MTTTPEPMDKLDAAAMAAVSGPADDPFPVDGPYGLDSSDLTGLLEPDAVKVASPVPRGAQR